MSPQELQRQIDELRGELDSRTKDLSQSIERVSKDVSSVNTETTLRFPVDDQTRKTIRDDVLAVDIFDVLWNNVHYYFNPWESLDGWVDSAAVASAVNGLFLRTTSSANNIAYAEKHSFQQNYLDFDSESRFRASFAVSSPSHSDDETLDNTEAYFGTGAYTSGGTGNIFADGLASLGHYGFYISEDVLYGITSDGANYTTLKLLDGLRFFDMVYAEARHYPGTKVTFSVSEPSSLIDGIENTGELFERGSISDTLPSGFRSSIAQFAVKTKESEDREIDSGFVEIIQRKNT